MKRLKRAFIIYLFCSSTLSFAESCPQGQFFDQKLNRCLLKVETVKTKSDAQNCDHLTGEDYKQCFHNNVDQQMNELQQKGDVQTSSVAKAKYGVSAAIALGAAYILFMERERILGQCKASSTYLMAAAGMSSILGEVLATNSYKKKTDDLRQQYSERMSVQDKAKEEGAVIDAITENQKIAFDFQIEQEQARSKAHKARGRTYTLAAGLYAASSIAAIYEGLTTAVKGCNFRSAIVSYDPSSIKINSNLFMDSQSPIDISLPPQISLFELNELILRVVFNNLFPSAHADAGGLAVTAGVGFAGYIAYAKGLATSEGGKTLNQAIRHPATRAAFSGLLMKYSQNIASDAKKNAQIAQSRVVALQELKASFTDNGGAGFSSCSQEERQDRSKAGCFCFDSAGNFDESKKGIPICQGLLSGASIGQAGKYGVAASSQQAQGLKGCVDENKKFDPQCRCRKKANKEDKQKNSCLKVSARANLGGVSKIKGLNGLFSDAVNFNRGRLSTADLGGSVGRVNNLIKQIDQKKKQLAKNKQYAPILKQTKDLERKLANAFRPGIQRALKSGSLSHPLGGGLFKANNSMDKKSLLQDVKKSFSPKKPNFKSSSPLAKNGLKKSHDSYDFGDQKNHGGVDLAEIDSVMEKEYSFNDINDDSYNNIFKIISVRYQRSGLRSLFDEKGISQADAPNSSDINEK